MNLKRECGILLHPTSLPGSYGIGDLGREAYQFIDFLARSNQKIWQILPLGPVGHGESPYQSLSAFAGNPLLLSPDKLKEEGLLTEEDLSALPLFEEKQIRFDLLKPWKEELLRKAFANFRLSLQSPQYLEFLEENRIWLANFSFFMALKTYFRGVAWNYWEKSIAFREPPALEHYRKLLQEEIDYHCFLQFQFSRQWRSLKEYAEEKGIKMMGDLPIFVAYDSSDAWANPHLFQLDQWGRPSKVAGVPPDYFSATGQLWGNPLYRWEEMEQDDYFWWRERFQKLFQLVDWVRVDHFRGFEAYWEIPGGEETAVNGRWVQAPGEKLFTAIKEYLGELPIVAEDLGIITPQVEELKNKFNFPGMKVLHFCLGSRGDRRDFLCHLPENTVVYTGTHDNDTSLGWYQTMQKEAPQAVKFLGKYFHINPQMSKEEIAWGLLKIVWKTPARIAIAPLQDLLALGTEARMNMPGTAEGNWRWRFTQESLTREIEEKMASLTQEFNR